MGFQAVGIGIITTIMASRMTFAASLPEAERYAPAEVRATLVPRVVVDPDASSLGLAELLAWADAHAPAIQVARAQVGMADAAWRDARPFFPSNPQISFAGGERRVDGTGAFEFEVAVQQQLALWGQRRAALRSAEERQRLARGVVEEVRWSVHVEVHRLYANVLVLGERLEQAERFVAFARSMRDIGARQVEAGESSPLVLLVTDADLAQTRSSLVEARQARDALMARLAAVIGWPDAQLPALDGELPPVRRAPDVPVLLERMTTGHPSLRMRELAVEAARAQLRSARRDALPQPTVGIAYTEEGAVDGPRPAIAMATLNLPLPVWRRNPGGRAGARAQLERAARERDQTYAELRGELVRAAIVLEAAVERVELYANGVVPQLEENLTLLERAYELGEVDVHQLSQTRERLLDAMGRYIDARVAYYDAVATLEGLVGAEIWPEEP